MAKGTVNKVILLGRLGNDPEVRQTQSGTTVATLSLATNEIVKDDVRTEWHRVVIFGKGAEVIQRYSKKGDALYIEGRIRTNKWQDNSGQDRYSTEIVANNFQFIGGSTGQASNYDNIPEGQPNFESVNKNDEYAKAKGKMPKMPSFDEINNNLDDDIPF